MFHAIPNNHQALPQFIDILNTQQVDTGYATSNVEGDIAHQTSLVSEN